MPASGASQRGTVALGDRVSASVTPGPRHERPPLGPGACANRVQDFVGTETRA